MTIGLVVVPEELRLWLIDHYACCRGEQRGLTVGREVEIDEAAGTFTRGGMLRLACICGAMLDLT